ncbi:MAG: hypothetical protein ACO2PN_19325 [Pyrobaculum sp.]
MAERVFVSAPVAAAVSAALWCRDWTLALPAAALLVLFLVASAAWRSTGLAAVCRSCRVGWRWGDSRMRRRLREG